MSSGNFPGRPLKSTASAYSNSSTSHFTPSLPPLPPGWTEHKAPTGHTYYYNAQTKVSTYTRPLELPFQAPPATVPVPQQFPFSGAGSALPGASHAAPYGMPYVGPYQRLPCSVGRSVLHFGGGRGGGFGPHHGQREAQIGRSKDEKIDRPKKKRAIPGCEPWVLVTTKLGRTFVHNLETKESLWKADEVQKGIDGLKNMAEEEQPEKEMKDITVAKQEPMRQPEKETEEEEANGETKRRGVKRSASAALESAGEGDQVEETEYEDEEEDKEPPSKRLNYGEDNAAGPVEFTEEDVNWQLQAMAEEYGLGEEDLEGEDLPHEDALLFFKELLSEYQVNPYSTWEAEYLKLVDDGRYTVLRTMKHRKDAFDEWCRDRIAELKKQKENQKKVDPRVIFWNFLVDNATPKLYWPEFKRKFKKNPEMKDVKLGDKDREKMYRDYISHIKASEDIRENDLKKLLKSSINLTRNTQLGDLPTSIITDVRYVVAPKHLRDDIIREHISRLPDNVTPEERKAMEERERKQQAVRDRERTVRRERARLRGEVEKGRELLKEEAAALEKAKIVGKRGLLSQIALKENEEVNKSDAGKGEKGALSSA